MPAVSAILSALHLLALGVGLSSIEQRARALAGPLDTEGLKRVFRADALWGIAALLWITTGAARAFGPLEKGTEFYLGNRLFHLKLGLFLLIFVLEIVAMRTLTGWRKAVRRHETPDLSRAKTLATLSRVEMLLVVVIVFIASFMARGFGIPG